MEIATEFNVFYARYIKYAGMTFTFPQTFKENLSNFYDVQKTQATKSFRSTQGKDWGLGST